jgi:arabinogalactan endo-1,4-beta-galactosidase
MKIQLFIIAVLMGIIIPAIGFSNQKTNTTEINTGVELVITPYSTTIFSDEHGKSTIVVRVVDKSGDDVRTTEAPLQIIVKGNASIAVDETGGNQQSAIRKTQDGIWEARLINGSCRFKLIAGGIPGKIKVEVRSEGLKSASTEIHSIFPFNLLIPKKGQLKPSGKTIGKMLGADISFLPQLESRGIQFSDKGVQKDAIEILKDHGFNYIRLRIFNNPAAAKGYSPQKGFCDLEHTKQMALRIKKAGMKLLLDFHYSDYWADPQQQNKPSAWDGLENEKLVTVLKDYTKDVLSALKSQGTLPDMVQIGNEINHGMVWPDGHIGNPDQLTRLIKAGVDGVKEVDPSIIIMLHIALGGQNDESVFWLDNMIARGVKFDIIGLSYYPRWHGTLSDLKNNMLDLISRYNKDINLVEYSQKKTEVNDIVFNLPNGRGKGTCIWEPLSTWEQIFDRDGKSNELINTYDKIAGKYLMEK